MGETAGNRIRDSAGIITRSDRGGPRPPGAVGFADDSIRRPEVGGHLSVREISRENWALIA